MENNHTTVGDLEQRWEKALAATLTAVKRHPEAYKELKSLTSDVACNPLDIRDYMPTARTMADLLQTLDGVGSGSIFHLFQERIAPTSVWQVNLFRMECRDLIDHLNAFDAWRLRRRHLTIVK